MKKRFKKLAVGGVEALLGARPLSVALLSVIYSFVLLALLAPVAGVWSYKNDYGQSVGYAHTLNWAYGFTILVPLMAFFLLRAFKEMESLPRRIAAEEMLLREDYSPHTAAQQLLASRWTKHRRSHSHWWLGITVVGLLGTVGEWIAYSLLPLARGVPPPEDEWDWSVKLVESSLSDRILNGTFSFLVYLQQAWLISLIALFLFLALAFSALIADLREHRRTARIFPSLRRCGQDSRLGFEQFAPFLQFYLLSGLFLYAQLFLSRVWNAFLHPGDEEVRFMTVFQLVKGPLLSGVKGQATDEGLRARALDYLGKVGALNFSGVAVALAATIIVAVSFAILFFTMRRTAIEARRELLENTRAKTKRECLEHMAIWPLRYPGLTTLMAASVLGALCMVAYRLGVYFFGMLLISGLLWGYRRIGSNSNV